MEGGCGVADQLAASALPPCARGGARQPGSINRGVLQIRPGAPNGTKVGVRRGLGAPHRRRPARGCSWSAAPKLAGFSTQSRIINTPEQEAAVEITARKSRRGALLHPHGTAVLFGVRSRASTRCLEGVRLSDSPARSEHRGSQLQKRKISTAVVGTCGLHTSSLASHHCALQTRNRSACLGDDCPFRISTSTVVK